MAELGNLSPHLHPNRPQVAVLARAGACTDGFLPESARAPELCLGTRTFLTAGEHSPDRGLVAIWTGGEPATLRHSSSPQSMITGARKMSRATRGEDSANRRYVAGYPRCSRARRCRVSRLLRCRQNSAQDRDGSDVRRSTWIGTPSVSELFERCYPLARPRSSLEASSPIRLRLEDQLWS